MDDRLIRRILEARTKLFKPREKLSDMDSSVVSAKIKRFVWPLLRERGFTKFASRTAWRYHPNRIDVLNFLSMGRYHADIIGCTSHSFSICLGSYIPEHDTAPAKSRDGFLKPMESACSIRRTLQKQIRQPELPRRDIWFIDDRGCNLDAVIGDALDVIRTEAFEWFEFWRDDEKALSELETADEENSGTWGFGAKGSSPRNVLMATLRIRIRQRETGQRTSWL